MNNQIAILHTTPATVTGLKPVCERVIPGVPIYNYLDDSLLPQINREGGVSEDVKRRFAGLVALAAAAGPRAILSACSTVGGLIEELRPQYTIPLLRIDEPMAEQAGACQGKLMVCATLPSTLGPTLELIQRKRGGGENVDHLVITEAGALLAAGRQEEYLRCIADALGDAARTHDLVVLAQASMAQALALLPPEQRGKFLTSPESGISALKEYL